jgi:hypothetical protein
MDQILHREAVLRSEGRQEAYAAVLEALRNVDGGLDAARRIVEAMQAEDLGAEATVCRANRIAAELPPFDLAADDYWQYCS